MLGERLLSGLPVKPRYDRDGEGFRMPAIAGRPCGDGPAYGNRPSTNPRGAGARLWGFEDSAATVWVVRWLRDGIYLGQLVVIELCGCVMKVLRRRQTGWFGRAHRGRGPGDWRRHM